MPPNRDQWQIPTLLVVGFVLGMYQAFFAHGGPGLRREKPQKPSVPVTPPPHVDTPGNPTPPMRDESLARVDRALDWLIRHQRRDGSWSFDLKRCPECGGRCAGSGEFADDYGATALAILPFLGRGYTHRTGPYKAKLLKTITLLRDRVDAPVAGKSAGQIYSEREHGMYVQGMATRALAECYAVSRDESLRAPAQRAVRFIEDARGSRGGWRYEPRADEADVVSTGCQVLALHFAKRAGLQVSKPGLEAVGRFLDTAAVDGGARYAYIGRNQEARDGPTAVALLSRMCLGWNDPALARGIDRLAALQPTDDLYFNYHAAQIMNRRGDAWFRNMEASLHRTQARDGHAAGSWYEGFERRESSVAGGRLFCTVMAALILETPSNPVVPR